MISLIAIIALLIGSFLNVCIYRIPREKSVVFPPSHCPGCGNTLKCQDLIPLVSYFVTRGKCRYCGSRISSRYPLVEGLNALLWLLLYNKIGISGQFIFFALWSSLLIVITFIDLEFQEIPDVLNLSGLALSLGAALWPETSPALLDGALGLLLGGGSFLIIALVSGGAMGGGDIKLMAVLGLFLGWQMIIVVFLLAFTLGACISVYLLVTGKKGRKDPIPFGPFIALAAVIVFLWGEGLWTQMFNIYK